VSLTKAATLATSHLTPDVAVPGLINGVWVEGTGEVKETKSPTHGGTVSHVRYFSDEQVDAAVEAARIAQKSWSRVPLNERAKLLHAGVTAVEERAEEISQWVSAEMGKTIRESREEVVTDIAVPVSRQIIEDALRFGGKLLPTARGDYYPDRRVMIMHQPIGVTGFISPWNFPVEMFLNCIASLMVGNACVWKPSEWAPQGPKLLIEAFMSVGIPDGVVNLIYGGPETGERLVTHHDVGCLGFIGSTATGEAIVRAAGVKRLLLELGGNGPIVVLDDADVDKAAKTALRDCFYLAGQACTAGERILVHEDVHDEFVEKLTALVEGLQVGDPLDEGTDMGPLSDKRILDKVIRHVDNAKASGATIVTGGTYEGLFYQPTVLTGVTTDMEIAREETFGPVAPVVKISSAEEALAIANSLDYGLSMSVFTSSMTTAFMMAEGMEAGQVSVNSGTNDWELNGPFGGWKKSGLGRELGGEEHLRALTNVKTVGFDLR
jgi:succinate-semialdehyde dehydrogenase/glutarate-semialdehyde dehydrogenase